MATYGTFQRRFSELTDLEKQHWDLLYEGVGTIFLRVSILLGLRPPAPEKLRLGVVNEDGKFQERSAEEIPKKSRQLEFSIELSLSDKESEFPPNRLITHWAVTREGTDFMLISNGKKIHITDFDKAAVAVIEGFSEALDEYDPTKKRIIY